MKLADIVKEITDVITLHGEWDGNYHIGYMTTDLNGVCNFGGCTDIVAVYVGADNVPLVRVHTPDDKKGTYVTLERFSEDVREKIYNDVMTLWHED